MNYSKHLVSENKLLNIKTIFISCHLNLKFTGKKTDR